MGAPLARAVEGRREGDAESRPRRPRGEERALAKMRDEAGERGALLANGGEGGLPSSLVLGVMRRDRFRCKRCGRNGLGVGGLSVHHKGGVVASPWLSRKGHSNDPNNLVTICKSCHDAVHEKARTDGVDSSQIKPEGDR